MPRIPEMGVSLRLAKLMSYFLPWTWQITVRLTRPELLSKAWLDKTDTPPLKRFQAYAIWISNLLVA